MRSILWIGGLLAAHACLAQHTVAMEHKTSHAARPTDPFLSGAPFTLDQTLNLLRQDAIPLRRRKEAIQSRGVDFSWSQETIEKLKATGASAELLELIESKARPAPAPPAPKPAPVGSISLKCAPTECNVAVNGHAVGSTLSGTLELARLAPGKWVVDLSKNGYISRQSSVLVDENKTATVSAVLEPDRTTEETFGTELFRKMVQAQLASECRRFGPADANAAYASHDQARMAKAELFALASLMLRAMENAAQEGRDVHAGEVWKAFGKHLYPGPRSTPAG